MSITFSIQNLTCLRTKLIDLVKLYELSSMVKLQTYIMVCIKGSLALHAVRMYRILDIAIQPYIIFGDPADSRDPLQPTHEFRDQPDTLKAGTQNSNLLFPPQLFSLCSLFIVQPFIVQPFFSVAFLQCSLFLVRPLFGEQVILIRDFFFASQSVAQNNYNCSVQ